MSIAKDKKQAERRCRRLLAKMKKPELWRMDVWDNCGWCYCLRSKTRPGMDIWEYLDHPRDRRYHAHLSWVHWYCDQHAATPELALTKSMRHVRKVVAHDCRTLAQIEANCGRPRRIKCR